MGILEELNGDEEIQKAFKPHPMAYLGWYVLGAIFCLTLTLAVLGIPIILVTELMRRGQTYYVTDRRVISELYFITRNTRSVRLSRIKRLKFMQNPIEKITGTGTILVDTEGFLDKDIELRGVMESDGIEGIIKKEVRHMSDNEKKIERERFY